MKIEYPNKPDPTPEEFVHLEKLKKLVKQAVADGKLSLTENQSIQDFIRADHQVTVEELRTVRATIREVLGDLPLEYDWDEDGA